MTFIKNGFICRKTSSGNRGRVSKTTTYRNWWLGTTIIHLKNFRIPKKLQGKRLRFKVQYFDHKKQKWKDVEED